MCVCLNDKIALCYIMRDFYFSEKENYIHDTYLRIYINKIK